MVNRILQMEHKRKNVQVAQPYNQYLRQGGDTKMRLLHGDLPSIIKEEETNEFLITRKNIFASQIQSRNKQFDLKSLKEYEYVGGKEIKFYHEKNLAKKKRHTSVIKRTESNLSLSRVSTVRNNEYLNYLTKDEVLKTFMPKQHPLLSDKLFKQQFKFSSQFQYVKINNNDSIKSQLSANKLNSNYNKLQHSELTKSNIKKIKNQERNNVVKTQSLKYKQNYQRYNQGWQNYKQKRHQICQNKNQVSVLQNVSNFRCKIEQKERNELKMKIEHISPKLWPTILRKQKTLNTLYDFSTVVHIPKSNIILKGINKLTKEIEWIQEKFKYGFLFKLNETDSAKVVQRKETEQAQKP